MYKMPQTLNLFMTLTSCLSLCGCLAVIYFHFQLDKSHRNKAYNKIILYVIISDFFVSIGTSFGIEKGDTFQCSLQAFLTTAFPLCSIFWTTVTFYLFYLAIKNRKSSKHVFMYLHCICWGLPIVLAVLPFLSGLRYGVKEESEHEWCSISNPNDVPAWQLTFWTFASFYFWIWLSVGGFSILIGVIFYELRSRVFFTNEGVNDRLRPIVRKMIFLPMIIVLCWTIPTCYRIYFYINDANVPVLQFMSAISAASKGFITSVILLATNTVQTYVSENKEVRNFTQYRDSEATHDPTDSIRFRESSLSSTLHNPVHQSHDDDDDDHYDRFLFRVHNDCERMSRTSGESTISGVTL